MAIFAVAAIPAVIMLFWLLYCRRQNRQNHQHGLSADYFKGLNYLLNDEQGKALDVFIRIVETNWDTIETHFALGKIYRRNGEMDKAIKIHQGLIGRPGLPEQYRSKVLLELGFDYLGAGWFDRAEGLFREVLIEDRKSSIARHNLMLIYQQEKDWHRAIDVATVLYEDKPETTGPMIAQYYCELADLARDKGDVVQLKTHAEQALHFDEKCVRASILLAEQACREKDDKAAIAHYRKIENQDPASLLLILNDLLACYQRLGDIGDFLQYIEALEARHEKLFLQVIHAEVLEKRHDRERARSYLIAQMKQRPTLEGIHKLLQYQSGEAGSLALAEEMCSAVERMQAARSHYRCRKCGLQTRMHYWLCPGCHHWGQMTPTPGEPCRTKHHEEERQNENRC